ncbi:MAG: O-antigen ligase family protein [Phycisphaerales bacterium]|nr:O-antigen ligase family protein [Phycisphaerales bacterium]
MTPTIPNPSPVLRRLGLACVLVSVCVRVLTTYDPLPGWSMDPFSSAAPQNGLGPAQSIMLSGLSLLGLALALAAAWRERERVPAALLTLAGLGLVPVAWHGWFGPGACVENQAVGLAWAGAIASALAASIACRHPAERALAVACCAGLAGPMVIRAAVQVYVEHPVLVEDFRANREALLASHGWSPESAMARSFERRLHQPDASAWFAMSNVYASVMAGCVAVFGAGCLDAVRARLWRTGERSDLYRALGLGLGLACSLGGLFLALPAGGSLPKGAAAAMVLGLGLLGLGVWHARLTERELHEPGSGVSFPARLASGARKAAPFFGPGLVVLALWAVGLRGLVGERVGELSLLFRFYYAQAALRIFGEFPVWGVGPDGFQAAYLLAKNPLNPEEVSSPHSVLLEYLSILGVLGAAWVGLVFGLASRAGASLLGGGREVGPAPAPEAPSAPAGRSPGRWFLAVVLLCIAASFRYEVLPFAQSAPDAFGLLLIDGATKLGAGGLLWLGLGAALLRVPPRTLAVGVAAGALAVLTHAQIELIGTDPAACGWFFTLLGCAASRPLGEVAERGPRPVGRLAPAFAGASCAVLAAAALVASVPVRAWQAELRTTAVRAAEPTALGQRARDLGSGRSDETPAALVADLSALLGRPVAPTPEAFNAGLDELRLARAGEAAGRLDALARARATPSRSVADAAIGARIAHCALTARLGWDPAKEAGAVVELASWSTARWPGDSRLWRDRAQAIRLAGEVAPQLAEAGEDGADIDPLLMAARLDPLSPQLASQLSHRLAEAGRGPEAREWAGRALANHAWRRLDPLAGLSENQVRSLRELLGYP